MFNYFIETIEDNEKNIYDFGTDYIKALLFLAQCQMDNIEAKIVQKHKEN